MRVPVGLFPCTYLMVHSSPSTEERQPRRLTDPRKAWESRHAFPRKSQGFPTRDPLRRPPREAGVGSLAFTALAVDYAFVCFVEEPAGDGPGPPRRAPVQPDHRSTEEVDHVDRHRLLRWYVCLSMRCPALHFRSHDVVRVVGQIILRMVIEKVRATSVTFDNCVAFRNSAVLPLDTLLLGVHAGHTGRVALRQGRLPRTLVPSAEDLRRHRSSHPQDSREVKYCGMIHTIVSTHFDDALHGIGTQ